MDHIETAILKLLWNPGSRTEYGLCCQTHTTRSYDPEHGRSDGSLPSILQSEDCRKHCRASASNRAEIHGHYRSCCWCKQTLPGTDHKTSERSKVHECISAVQQLFRSCLHLLFHMES